MFQAVSPPIILSSKMYFLAQNVFLKLKMYFLSITNEMQRYKIFFITVNALHVSGGFSAHHHELKNVFFSSKCIFKLKSIF